MAAEIMQFPPLGNESANAKGAVRIDLTNGEIFLSNHAFTEILLPQGTQCSH
jgi:hypothetical protein